MTTNVTEIVDTDCPRCLEYHQGLVIRKFTRPIEIEVEGLIELFNWYGICPILEEPIIGKDP